MDYKVMGGGYGCDIRKYFSIYFNKSLLSGSNSGSVCVVNSNVWEGIKLVKHKNLYMLTLLLLLKILLDYGMEG